MSTRRMRFDGTKTLSWKFPPGKGHATGSSGRLEVTLGTNDKVTELILNLLLGRPHLLSAARVTPSDRLQRT